MFRLSCQRVLILGTLRPFLPGSLNVGLSQDLSFIGAELNDRLWSETVDPTLWVTAAKTANIADVRKPKPDLLNPPSIHEANIEQFWPIENYPFSGAQLR